MDGSGSKTSFSGRIQLKKYYKSLLFLRGPSKNCMNPYGFSGQQSKPARQIIASSYDHDPAVLLRFTFSEPASAADPLPPRKHLPPFSDRFSASVFYLILEPKVSPNEPILVTFGFQNLCKNQCRVQTSKKLPPRAKMSTFASLRPSKML